MAAAVIPIAAGGSRQSLRQRLQLRREAMKTEVTQSGFLDHWKDLSDYILPRRGRFTLGEPPSDGRKKGGTTILDATATYAARTLSSGMMSGFTNPSRPWFKLGAPDVALERYRPVREWLDEATRRMESVFQRSNLYNILPGVYESLGVFGSAVFLGEGHSDTLLRFSEFPIGTYQLANGADGRVRTIMREVWMTVSQMVERFGEKYVSDAVLTKWRSGRTEDWTLVVQVIEPRAMRDLKSPLARDKKIASVWFDPSDGQPDRLLKESGFDSWPAMTPRWWISGEDIYGRSPGMEALPDVKGLQLVQRRKYEALDKRNNPPMLSHPDIRNHRLFPGGITTMPSAALEQPLRPAYELSFNLDEYRHELLDLRAAVKRGFFEDLFLMLTDIDRSNITATEIAERKEEKLLMLGPVLERIEDEALGPLIDRTFDAMWEAGMIPTPPDEMRGMPLRVEYISILAQAQRAVGTQSLDRLVNFVGAAAGLGLTDTLHKIDQFALVDQYADKLGVSPKVVRASDDAAQSQQRMQMAQAAAAAAQAAKPAAGAAKDLSETEMEKDSALDRMMAAAGQAAGR